VIRTLRGILRLLRTAVRRGTVPEIFKYSAQSFRHEILGGQAEYLRHTRFARFPLVARRHTTDQRVFAQIFVEREYTPVDGWTDVETVVDCGANVGYSSAYFLTAFPESRVIALEPEPDNYRVLSRNLEPYGSRAVAVNTALWSRPGYLQLRESDYRGGGAWSRQVDEPAHGESGSVEAIDMPSLMERFGLQRVSLLKMDIEGAETVVFSERTSDWLPRVDALVVELHDDTHFGPATPVFARAIAPEGFEVTESGELSICRRRRR
jgi:FkbM family methyltransferase